jgi:hypothetical protein
MVQRNLCVVEVPHPRVAAAGQHTHEDDVGAEIRPDELVAVALHTRILDVQIDADDVPINPLLKTLVERVVGLTNQPIDQRRAAQAPGANVATKLGTTVLTATTGEWGMANPLATTSFDSMSIKQPPSIFPLHERSRC